MSMIQFKDQVDWFREQLEAGTPNKTVFVFESMPEAMSLTKVGSYEVGEGKAGMPDMVKKIAKMLVKGRDEDAMYGYMKLMKIMRTILPLVPKRRKTSRTGCLYTPTGCSRRLRTLPTCSVSSCASISTNR